MCGPFITDFTQREWENTGSALVTQLLVQPSRMLKWCFTLVEHFISLVYTLSWMFSGGQLIWDLLSPIKCLSVKSHAFHDASALLNPILIYALRRSNEVCWVWVTRTVNVYIVRKFIIISSTFKLWPFLASFSNSRQWTEISLEEEACAYCP